MPFRRAKTEFLLCQNNFPPSPSHTGNELEFNKSIKSPRTKTNQEVRKPCHPSPGACVSLCDLYKECDGWPTAKVGRPPAPASPPHVLPTLASHKGPHPGPSLHSSVFSADCEEGTKQAFILKFDLTGNFCSEQRAVYVGGAAVCCLQTNTHTHTHPANLQRRLRHSVFAAFAVLSRAPPPSTLVVETAAASPKMFVCVFAHSCAFALRHLVSVTIVTGKSISDTCFVAAASLKPCFFFFLIFRAAVENQRLQCCSHYVPAFRGTVAFQTRSVLLDSVRLSSSLMYSKLS